MKVSGFSYVRNGLKYGYPFLEAIQSILPLCDEFIAVVGDSTDGTREAIESLNDPKIRIVDTVWDDALRQDGHIFSQQSNIGLDHCTGDWCFHIQADEVIHEKDLPVINQAMEKYVDNREVDGLLFKFINFYGDYKHYAPSRRYHNKEIRIVRNSPFVRSYGDSQGFRLFREPGQHLAGKGTKLHVKPIDATIYHYSYVKSPATQLTKMKVFGDRWHSDSGWFENYAKRHREGYDYNQIDILKVYTGTHPAIMSKMIAAQDWEFKYDPSKSNMSIKEKLMYFIEKHTGKRLFNNTNYTII